MTIEEAVRKAVAGDAAAAGLFADAMRSCGMNYKQIFEIVQGIEPEVTLAKWDALLAEADHAT